MSVTPNVAPVRESVVADVAALGSSRLAGDATGSSLLRWSLRGTDLAALVLAWAIADVVRMTVGAHPGAVRPHVVAGLGVIGLYLINAQDLHLARVATMRMVEQARLARVAALLVLVAGTLDWLTRNQISPGFVLGGAALSFALLLVSRTAYRGWLESARTSGRFVRPVLLVGIDDQAREIRQVLDEQPELGFCVVGALGTRQAARESDMLDIWLGELDELPSVAGSSRASGAIVSSTALQPEAVNAATRELLERKFHIHVSAGLSGLDQRRLRSVHVGYEPLLYVEHVDLTRTQLVVKRAIDLTVSAVALVLTAPVLLAAAVAIKATDRGPVLFRQERVGRDGEPFTVLKLRTMTVGAEEQLDRVVHLNQRSGPLFKLDRDPRITPVGRLLRTLSIDELPQFLNVLRGDMSVVGPRPALPSEVEKFDEALRERTRVRPGITGLWQVEARDNPSFHAYKRLDLFYVENWSVGLDAMVIVATIESELSRMVRRAVGSEARVGT